MTRNAEKLAAVEQARADAREKATQLVPLDQVPRTATELRNVCRMLSPWAIQTLVEIASDRIAQPAGRVSALNSLIDRGYGKPVQPVRNEDANPLEEMDDEALDAYVLKGTTQFIEQKVIERDERRPATVEGPLAKAARRRAAVPQSRA